MNKYFNVTFGETIENPYKLPIASDSVLGGIKIGDGLTIDENGILSVEPIDSIKIGTSIIETGENSTQINYTGTIIGLLAWENNQLVLNDLDCNIVDNQVIFNSKKDVIIPIECKVVYI